MDLMAAIQGRVTTNGAFDDRPVSRADQLALVRAASCAPSHFNSQPWRFVLIDDRHVIDEVAAISGDSMRQLMDEGLFWQRYLRYFRFSEAELEQRRDGILIDHLPKALRPFRQHIFGPSAQRLMRRLGVAATLGEDNRALVAGAPLLIAALLDREEYVPGELSAFYSVFGLGAAIENLWLTTVELGLGIQFVSAPMEIPEQWARIERLLDVPDDLALMAVYRVGHVPATVERPRIDWSSRHRKRLGDYVFRNSCSEPEREPEEPDGAVEHPVHTHGART